MQSNKHLIIGFAGVCANGLESDSVPAKLMEDFISFLSDFD